MPSSRPIVVVTGANSGVGFGICQRLLLQLSQENPPDALPLGSPGPSKNADILSPDGLTIIMACRSVKRAELAREDLRRLFDKHVEREKQKINYDGYAEEFRENLQIDIHALDLSSMKSVFEFGAKLNKTYPYISHLICNAGMASYKGMDWILFCKQFFRSPIMALTAPEFNIQRSGEMSGDNLGWVWQCNFFGHYALFRLLSRLISATPSPLEARVIWMSSLEASPKFYNPSDFQLINTEHPYESSKYELELVSSLLDRTTLQSGGTRHFIVEPGVCATRISETLLGWAFLEYLKEVAMYFARLLGSPHHTILPLTAAISAVHIALTTLASLPTSAPFPAHENKPHNQKDGSVNSRTALRPIKFSSQTSVWGTPRVEVMDVRMGEDYEEESERLLKECDKLFDSYAEKYATA